MPRSRCTSRETDRRAEAQVRRHHQRRSRRSARRRRAAFRGLHPRRARALAADAHRSARAGFPRPARRSRSTSSRPSPPDVMNHNLETVPRLYKQARPGRGLRAFAQAAEGLQGALSRHSDEVGPDGGPGRNRRGDRRSHARPARARRRHADDRPVPAAARATCRCCATSSRRCSKSLRSRRRRWASCTPRADRWCARAITPTSRRTTPASESF